jgi:SNF2 family DNA or RNA helicase
VNDVFVKILDSQTFNTIITFLLGAGVASFRRWWKRREDRERDIIETQGRHKASLERLWEKTIMLRRVMETRGWTIPDKEWDYQHPKPDSSKSSDP